MASKRLSGREIPAKIAIGIFFLSPILILDKISVLAMIFVSLISSWFIYVKFYFVDRISFDEENMYVIYKKGTVVIKLSDIYYVTTSSVGFGYLGTIKYKYQANKYVVHYFPRYFSTTVSEFEDLVKKNNSHVLTGRIWYPFEGN